ncbi:hypothetical protein HGRIS_009348 [Hohenbuehelia grisea]|uniref:DUF6532 domain-containing protein n=1 Tax=Hohenbuehelia grisea TaxID=104357 RepID=A0ABR3J298_9AGAR
MMSSKSSIILGTRIPHLLNNQASPRRANEQRLVDSHFQLIPLIDESQQKPQWSAGPSTSDTHASPKPRHRKHSIDQALESAGSDLNDVDVNTERDAPTVSNSGWPTEAHFTPKAPGQRSLNLKAQPLALQSVLRTAIRKSNTHGLFENAYPSTDGGFKHFRTILRTSARSLGYEKLADRFTRDTQFGIIIARPVCYSYLHLSVFTLFTRNSDQGLGSLTNLRGEFKKEAKAVVSGYYNILAGENVEATVKALLKDSKYIFQMDPTSPTRTLRTKPFHHDSIVAVLHAAVFKGSRGTLADKHGNHFKSSMTEGPKASNFEIPPQWLACLQLRCIGLSMNGSTLSQRASILIVVFTLVSTSLHTSFLSQIKTNNLRLSSAHG